MRECKKLFKTPKIQRLKLSFVHFFGFQTGFRKQIHKQHFRFGRGIKFLYLNNLTSSASHFDFRRAQMIFWLGDIEAIRSKFELKQEIKIWLDLGGKVYTVYTVYILKFANVRHYFCDSHCCPAARLSLSSSLSLVFS